MKNIKFIANMASLAQASYADFPKAIDLSDAVLKHLGTKPFSKMQASDLVEHWSVVEGSHQPNMPSGFSATLFQGKPDLGDMSGQYVLAIRGTEEMGIDLAGADGGDILLDGLAVDQIIEFYNYSQKLTSIANYQAAKLKRVEEIHSSRGVYRPDTLRKQRKLAA